MKNLVFVFLASVLIIGSIACSKETASSDNKLEEIQVETRATLSYILANGVSTLVDFDTLRVNDEYPFDVLSESDFSDYKDAVTFGVNGNFRGDTFGLHDYLTENQYKIWFQKALHGNITIDYDGGPTTGVFLNPIFGEEQYSDKTGFDDFSALPHNKAVIVENEDQCPVGTGGCSWPL